MAQNQTQTNDDPTREPVDLETLPRIDSLPGPLAQRIHAILRAAILDLTLPPGAVLRKSVLCDLMGVSRSPISEAITRLSVEGLVDVVPQSRTHVTHLSLAKLEEEVFLRDAIEVSAARRLAEVRTDDQMLHLTRNLRLQRLLVEDGDHRGFFQTDEEMHDLLISFTGFPTVARVIAQSSLNLRRARLLVLPENDRAAESADEHARIVSAIADRDPSAAEHAMRDHLSKLMAQLIPLRARCPTYFREP